MRFVALLRGVNIGGNKKVSMQRLKETLEAKGFTEVKTLLNSGNAAFEASKGNEKTLSKKLSVLLEKEFGFTVPTIVLSHKAIAEIVEKNPFKDAKEGEHTRFYATFFAEAPAKALLQPITFPGGAFRILSASELAAYSVLDLSQEGTTQVMLEIEKRFGKNVTTRNWNTVRKLAKL